MKIQRVLLKRPLWKVKGKWRKAQKTFSSNAWSKIFEDGKYLLTANVSVSWKMPLYTPLYILFTSFPVIINLFHGDLYLNQASQKPTWEYPPRTLSLIGWWSHITNKTWWLAVSSYPLAFLSQQRLAFKWIIKIHKTQQLQNEKVIRGY